MNNGALWPYMPSRLIQANERNYPKQAISAVGANEQRPTAGRHRGNGQRQRHDSD